MTMRRLWFLLAALATLALAGCQSSSQPTPVATVTLEAEANASPGLTPTTGITTVESEQFTVDIPASLRPIDPAAPALDAPYNDSILLAKLGAIGKRNVRLFAADFEGGQLLAIVELAEGESYASITREMADIGALVQSKNRTPSGKQQLHAEVTSIGDRRHVVYYYDELYKDRPHVIGEIKESIKPKG